MLTDEQLEIISDFNPHHPQGGDLYMPNTFGSATDFNPHHPQGGDKNFLAGWSLCCNFNPHHPQGGDTVQLVSKVCRIDFNPHHPQGGDLSDASGSSISTISIHTTRKVVTQTVGSRWHINTDFNPHHPQGGDKEAIEDILKDIQFQSTPPARW